MTTRPRDSSRDVAAGRRIVVVASLAGLLFGLDTAVIAGVTGSLRSTFALSPAALGWLVSSALWGTFAGAVLAGRPGDRYGTRAMLRVVAGLYVVAALGSALAWDLVSLASFRFLIGLAIGASSVLAPVYIAEVAPAGRRGRLVALFQVNIVAGILLAYVSNFAVGVLDAASAAWRLKLAAPVLPALVFLGLLTYVPASPRWLVHRGRIDEARHSLMRLGEPDPDEALRALVAPPAAGPPAAGGLSWRRHRRPILLAVTLALFNQLSGINAILYYLSDIFAAAGFGTVSADLQAISVGVANLLATLVGMLLIDRLGRRALLLAGALGTALAQAGVALVMAGLADRSVLLALLVAFIASFAVSQGTVIWVYLSELFPTAVRARGQALGSGVHWVANALIALVFPAVAALSRPAPFVFFALMMVLQFAVVLIGFPETRGVALDDIEAALAGKAGARIGR